MAERFLYFDSPHAIAVHDWIIEHSGGRQGINNLDLLESPLEMIQDDFYYPDVVSKVTHLFYSINKNHAFVDGNKRSGIALSAYFLQLNGYDYTVKRFVTEMENIAVWVAMNMINKDLLAELVESLIFEDEYSEALKLKIVQAWIASDF
jgi:death-on-curing protein